MEVVLSVNQVPIRLTSERWVHIVENHDDLAGRFHEVLEAVAEPDMVLEGKDRELLAVRIREPLALIVVYKETVKTDGFVITAFQTSNPDYLTKGRATLWRNQQPSKKL